MDFLVCVMPSKESSEKGNEEGGVQNEHRGVVHQGHSEDLSGTCALVCKSDGKLLLTLNVADTHTLNAPDATRTVW